MINHIKDNNFTQKVVVLHILVLIIKCLFFPDNVSGMLGSFEKHDIPVRSRTLPNVRRPNVRMSNLQKSRRKENTVILANMFGNLILSCLNS